MESVENSLSLLKETNDINQKQKYIRELRKNCRLLEIEYDCKAIKQKLRYILENDNNFDQNHQGNIDFFEKCKVEKNDYSDNYPHNDIEEVLTEISFTHNTTNYTIEIVYRNNDFDLNSESDDGYACFFFDIEDILKYEGTNEDFVYKMIQKNILDYCK